MPNNVLVKAYADAAPGAQFDTVANSPGNVYNHPLAQGDTGSKSHAVAYAGDVIWNVTCRADGQGGVTYPEGTLNGELRVFGGSDMQGGEYLFKQLPTATDPGIIVNVPNVPGNVDNGQHLYSQTLFSTSGRETNVSPGSAQVIITDQTVNGQVHINLAQYNLNSGVEFIGLYRTLASDPTGKRYLVAKVPNNQKQFVDNFSDAQIKAFNVNPPTENQTGYMQIDGDFRHNGKTFSMYGRGPVTQQPGGDAQASDVWGPTEKTMLQKVYNVLRLLGPLS